MREGKIKGGKEEKTTKKQREIRGKVEERKESGQGGEGRGDVVVGVRFDRPLWDRCCHSFRS